MFRFNRKPKKGLVGVDISSSSVKLLELSVKNGRYVVNSYASVPLAEGSVVDRNIVNAEAVTEAIEAAIQEANPASDLAVFALPTTHVIYKTIDMDRNMTDDEREIQIRLDAEQYIPFPLDEVSLDFEVLADELGRADRVKTRLVATRTENVDTRNEVLIYAGLTPKVADVENLALERAYETFSDMLPISAKTVVVIDIGESMMTITVLNNGETVYTKEQMFGGKQLTLDIQSHYGLSYPDAEQAKRNNTLAEDYYLAVLEPFMATIAQQVRRSLQLFFSTSQYTEIDHVLLAGGSANLKGLAKYLQDDLNYRVTTANPFLQMSFSPQVNLQKIKEDAPALMVACGVALRSFS